MFIRILEIFLPLLTVVVVGYVYARRARPDFAGAVRVTLDLGLPALSFSAMATMPVTLANEGLFVLAAILVMAASGLIAALVARPTGIEARPFAATMMFGNVGQIGLPLTALAFGPEGLKTGVLLMAAANICHFSVGVYLMSGRADFRSLFANPTIWATAAGLAFSVLGLALPAWTMVAIRTIGEMLVPVMLLSMGARMTSIPWSSWRIGVLGGLFAPLSRLLPALACVALLPLPPVQQGALILFGALPSAILNYMLADRYGRSPDAIAAIVMIGHLIAIVVLPLGLYLALS